MDEPFLPEAGGCRLSLEAAGEAWSWRLTAPGGGSVRGLAPDRATARRSAAFAAFAVTALEKAKRRWF
ncbi:MAG: hypothetical protein JF588_14560 [Caulobacterales bacterium]|nr:hypothetical protein [Caulobacterales bacterium]